MKRKNNKIIVLLVIILNLAIVFSVFVFFVIGFGTAPRIDCAHELNSAKEIDEACRNQIPFFHKMFMVEIFIGLIIIVVSNYFF